MDRENDIRHVTPSTASFFLTSKAFDFSVWELWGGLLYGGCVVVVPYEVSRDPEAFYSLLVDEQVTVLNQTPSAFYQLIQVDSCHDKSMHALFAFAVYYYYCCC